MTDKIKLGVAFLLVVAGIAGFYALHESAAVVKLASVLLGMLLAVAVAWTTEPGKRLFMFGKESVAEAKRVVWPTRKETMQTTGHSDPVCGDHGAVLVGGRCQPDVGGQ